MTKQLVLSSLELSTVFDMQDIAGQLMPSSRRVYEIDARHFATWIQSQGLTPSTLTRSGLLSYRRWLIDVRQSNGKPYSNAARQRMFSVAVKLMREYSLTHHTENVTQEVSGFKVSGESTHIALTKRQAREILDEIDTTTLKGKRNYALLLLLLKTGMRRAECVALDVEDITERDGHHVAIIRHGKGDKVRIVKLRVDVYRALEEYRLSLLLTRGPLFVRFYKGDHPSVMRLTDKAIELLVATYAPPGLGLTPHCLRASFATIALEGQASLHQVQYAMGHADPRTTERYQRRKLNLDNNAVDNLDF